MLDLTVTKKSKYRAKVSCVFNGKPFLFSVSIGRDEDIITLDGQWFATWTKNENSTLSAIGLKHGISLDMVQEIFRAVHRVM